MIIITVEKIVKYNQPETYEKIKKKYNYKEQQEQKDSELTFEDFRSMMEEGHTYKRGKGGSRKQIR